MMSEVRIVPEVEVEVEVEVGVGVEVGPWFFGTLQITTSTYVGVITYAPPRYYTILFLSGGCGDRPHPKVRFAPIFGYLPYTVR